MAPHKNKITLTGLFLHFEQPIAVLMHVWADYQTETEEGGYRASIVSLNAIRPCFCYSGLNCGCGEMPFFYISHTHTHTHPAMAVVQLRDTADLFVLLSVWLFTFEAWLLLFPSKRQH